MSENVSITQIRLDLQTRASTDQGTISEYAQSMREGAVFPPVTLFRGPDGVLWLADGFHRVLAAQQCGRTEIECDVRAGSRLDALKHAVGANQAHGIRRTNADKRRAVELALEAFKDLSNREIGAMCGVSHTFVNNVRGGNGFQLTGQSGNGFQLDKTGRPIPAHLIPMWERNEEIQDMLTTLSRLKCKLEHAKETDDPVFRRMNINLAIVSLKTAYDQMKVALAYAVCPICNGETAESPCRLCRGKGLISEFHWNNLPRLTTKTT